MAIVLTVGLLVPVVTAAPAFAYTNICQDSTINSNTPVYAAPSYSSTIMERVGYGNPENNAGYEDVACQFYNNVAEGRWYMPVRTWWSGNGIGGYIWVQDLNWSRTHHCWTLLAGYQSIPSGYCFLTRY